MKVIICFLLKTLPKLTFKPNTKGSNNPGTARKFNFTGYTKKTINLK
jgi:hypothetical protein